MTDQVKPERIVFFDLETGGLDPARHPIIQLAAVATDARDGLRELGAIELKVKFDPAAADPEALAGNSYDADAWERDAHPGHVAAGALSGFLRAHSTVEKTSARTGRAYRVARLAGHNAAAFDWQFLRSWYDRLGSFLPADYRVLDTLQLAAWLAYSRGGEVGGLGLSDLAARLGVEREGEAHDALSDVRLTVGVARVLMADLGSLAGAAPPVGEVVLEARRGWSHENGGPSTEIRDRRK